MRIGILGGSFNPIHNGHLALAKEAKSRLGLDRVIFVPAYLPPHKNPRPLADAEDRFNMVRLAIKGKEGLEVSRFEIDRKGRSYSIDTVEYLRKSYPAGTEFSFLIGADTLRELKGWKDADRLLGLCRFVVFNRPGFSRRPGYKDVREIDIEPVSISSTEIRSMIRGGCDISGLLPRAVRDYIKTKNLYK